MLLAKETCCLISPYAATSFHENAWFGEMKPQAYRDFAIGGTAIPVKTRLKKTQTITQLG